MIIQQKRFYQCLIALFIRFTSNETVLAQAISGTVVGTVRDSSGAMVANATVTAINSDTGISQATITSAEGGVHHAKSSAGNL